MINFSDMRILILSPHTDDGELSAGGTITRAIEEEGEVYYVAFSSCEKSVPMGCDCDILKRECLSATHTLGIPRENISLLNYEVRDFPQLRQNILDDLLTFKKEIQPDVVITPSSFDVHQDHQVIHMESIRAFKKQATILGMEHPWNNFGFKTDVNIILSEKNVQTKISALNEYKSQRDRAYFSNDYIRSLAKTHGLNVDSEYAESFECIRIIA